MRAAGAIYQGSDRIMIAVYNSFSDIYSKLPENIYAIHIKHAKFTHKNDQSVDLFLLDNNYTPQSLADAGLIGGLKLKKQFNNRSNIDVLNIFTNQHVRLETVAEIKGTNIDLESDNMLAQDFAMFCRNASKIKGFEQTYSNEIVPVTMIEYVSPTHLLKSGKADFIPQCVLNANLDPVSVRGECVSLWVPGKNASFNNNIFTGFYSDKSAGCEYCYAGHHHLDPYVKSFLKIEKKQLTDELLNGNFTNPIDEIYGKHVKILRLGKRTEFGSIFNREQLKIVLETCAEAKTAVVMPTKLLEFDKSIVELLKSSNTQLLYSISNLDALERGPLKYGCTNDWRLEQAIKYHEAGVNAGIYLMTELVYNNSIAWKKTLETAIAHNLPTQILGERIPKKDLAIIMTGKTWEQLKGPKRQEFDTSGNPVSFGGYSLTGNTSLTSEEIHPDIKKLLGNNNGLIRGCFHTKEYTCCGGCFKCNGSITDTAVPDFKRVSKNKKNNRRNKDTHPVIPGF